MLRDVTVTLAATVNALSVAITIQVAYAWVPDGDCLASDLRGRFGANGLGVGGLGGRAVWR